MLSSCFKYASDPGFIFQYQIFLFPQFDTLVKSLKKFLSLGTRIEFNDFMRNAGRTIERPITCCDVLVVNQMDGALEDVKSILVNPTIPIAFIELLTVRWVSEKPSTVANFRPQCFVVLRRS